MKKFIEFIKYILKRIIETRVTDSAAAIAYYAILSFFPLVLFLIAFNSSFLQSGEIQNLIFKLASEYMPGPSAEALLIGNLQHLVKASSTVGIIGTIMVLWSATLVFAGFAQNINMAWSSAPIRHFLVDRLIGLIIIGILIIFLIFSLISTTLLDLLPRIFPSQFESLFNSMSTFTHLIIDYLPIFAICFLLLLLYKFIPNASVEWKESAVGTFFSIAALHMTKQAFVWYLSFGPDSYNLIYGSLGAVVAFMLWIYLSSFIILVGGHICAAVATFLRPALPPLKDESGITDTDRYTFFAE